MNARAELQALIELAKKLDVAKRENRPADLEQHLFYVAARNCIPALSSLLEQGEAVTEEGFDKLRGEARELAVHRHDCPKVWDFFQKHAGLTVESALPQSCFACGNVGERAITHLELPNIYICTTCASAIRAPGGKRDE